MMTFLLLVTWLAFGQPPSDYQVPFSSNEACEAARLQLIKDAERIGQSMIERASAQDRQIGGNNKTALLMAAISNASLRLSRPVFKRAQARRNVAKNVGPARGEDWTTAIAGGGEEVVGEVLAVRAVLFAADSAVGTMRNRGDSTNYRKLAEHKIATCPVPLQ